MAEQEQVPRSVLWELATLFEQAVLEHAECTTCDEKATIHACGEKGALRAANWCMVCGARTENLCECGVVSVCDDEECRQAREWRTHKMPRGIKKDAWKDVEEYVWCTAPCDFLRGVKSVATPSTMRLLHLALGGRDEEDIRRWLAYTRAVKAMAGELERGADNLDEALSQYGDFLGESGRALFLPSVPLPVCTSCGARSTVMCNHCKHAFFCSEDCMSAEAHPRELCEAIQGAMRAATRVRDSDVESFLDACQEYHNANLAFAPELRRGLVPLQVDRFHLALGHACAAQREKIFTSETDSIAIATIINGLMAEAGERAAEGYRNVFSLYYSAGALDTLVVYGPDFYAVTSLGRIARAICPPLNFPEAMQGPYWDAAEARFREMIEEHQQVTGVLWGASA